MGLFSDYLEECRDRCAAGDIDPCLIISTKNGYGNYNKIYKQLEEYSQTDLGNEQRMQLQKQLIQNSAELEKLKASYLISEKAVYEVLNTKPPKSILIRDILEALKWQLHQCYLQICELRKKIDQKLGRQKIPTLPLPSESSIRQNVLERLINSVLMHMSNGVITNTSECRKVIKDCAGLIRCLEQEDYSWNDKDVFSYYLEKQFKIKKGQHRCMNCGALLHEDIPYCLNCYERNL